MKIISKGLKIKYQKINVEQEIKQRKKNAEKNRRNKNMQQKNALISKAE